MISIDYTASRLTVLLVGGGLAGLVAALDLARRGHRVVVVERRPYPFHRVCGEYVSNEVLPYLRRLGADPASLNPAGIRRFGLSSPVGRMLASPLDLGGFGISRYELDHFLYQRALAQGVEFLFATVADVAFDAAADHHTVTLADGRQLRARLVLGTYGKRSALDRQLGRPFFGQRSPYLGVKYHLQLPGFARDVIELHNFRDGYAGISAIEADKLCFCYLTTRANLKAAGGTIAALESEVLARNPRLADILNNAKKLYSQPEVINEISFAPKQPVEQHLLMVGDAAGLITPLCGNGMAMALHGAALAAPLADRFLRGQLPRPALEAAYARAWRQQFGTRLRVGRAVQRLFGGPVLSELAVGGLRHWPAAVRTLMRQTHGKPFS
ncbi:NAD(P)/FAD-dependent oxidoreductase [Hymenobacter baengnokdamensis]|uniref:NAD(P)/FAD-dependent oxidoreductase n=1 Tax=Hymenobacter baengnokdamensis TaxID=2615203 RepID=UPI001E574541|nr:FAD-dependent oxidoreductase [Hymenobacter baengnokdamensis]